MFLVLFLKFCSITYDSSCPFASYKKPSFFWRSASPGCQTCAEKAFAHEWANHVHAKGPTQDVSDLPVLE